MRTWKVWQPHKGERAVHATEVEAFDADAAVEQVHENDSELDDDEVFCVQACATAEQWLFKVQVIPSTREYVPSATTFAPLTVERLRARCSCGLRFFDHDDPGHDGLCRRCWVKAWEARGNERVASLKELFEQGVVLIRDESPIVAEMIAAVYEQAIDGPRPAAVGAITQALVEQVRDKLDARLADIAREIEDP